MLEAAAFRPDRAVELTCEIVAAYVSGNHVQAFELPALIASVNAVLSNLGKREAVEPERTAKPTAAQIKNSVRHDGIVSFEDGRIYKMLRRHLTLRGLTGEAYRAKWGLPTDYPMTSPAYSAQRSALAHSFGLGQQRRKSNLPVADATEKAYEPPKARSRRKGAKPA